MDKKQIPRGSANTVLAAVNNFPKGINKLFFFFFFQSRLKHKLLKLIWTLEI